VAKPDGLLVVPVGGELAFLHPLPLERLWGVGPATAAKLRERGFRTAGDVADVDARALVAMLGPAAGRQLHALVRGRDTRPVTPTRRRRSIGAQAALGRRRRSQRDLDTRLLGLVERVCHRLRAAGRMARTVVLRLRFDDFSRMTRSHSLAGPTADTALLLAALRHLLQASVGLIRDRGISLIGVTLANLEDAEVRQLMLPFALHGDSSLDAAVDRVRDRYGSRAITRGVLLGSDPLRTVPLLPD
jgi:DNA polymerase-4